MPQVFTPPGDRTGSRTGASARQVEQFAQREPEAGQDVASIEALVLGQQGRFVDGGEDAGRPTLRIEEPDEPSAGVEILAEFATHLLGSVALADDLDGQ